MKKKKKQKPRTYNANDSEVDEKKTTETRILLEATINTNLFHEILPIEHFYRII